MTTETAPPEFPQAFERRLGMQLVEEGLQAQSAFFERVAQGLLHCDKGDAAGRVAMSSFMTLFGRTYLEASREYMSNVPVSAFASSIELPAQLNIASSESNVLALMLFCEAMGPTGSVITFGGRFTKEAERRLACTTFTVPVSKFSTARPTETVDECLHRFITSEKTAFEAMQFGDGPEFVKWTLRYIYAMTITRMIEAMDPEFVTMKADTTEVRFVVHQGITGTEHYSATFILLNLEGLLAQGVDSFEKQIYRHPRYRVSPSDLSKEVIVKDKIERDISAVIAAVIAEVPEEVKAEASVQGFIQELNEVVTTAATTAPEARAALWNQFIETMNAWMPPCEVLEHPWKAKALAKMMDQSEEKVLEATQRYVAAEDASDD